MGGRCEYNFGDLVTRETREAIEAEGLDCREYAANVETQLGMRGLHRLAARMLEEIEASLAERAAQRERVEQARRRAIEDARMRRNEPRYEYRGYGK